MSEYECIYFWIEPIINPLVAELSDIDMMNINSI
jgi:hypothetical protein